MHEQSPIVFNIQTYMTLLLMSGFVLFDTQLIIVKASLGITDYVDNAVNRTQTTEFIW
jgi:hypothetical protein